MVISGWRELDINQRDNMDQFCPTTVDRAEEIPASIGGVALRIVSCTRETSLPIWRIFLLDAVPYLEISR